VYAHIADFDRHEAARAWLDARLNGSARVALPWPSLLAFVRLVTNPRVFARPEPAAAAWRQVEEWLDCESAWIPETSQRHREILGRLILRTSATGNLIPDAHLAALAIEHGLTLATTDAGFARFPDLRWEDPLSS
jgi:toxin-antitoxin system PIN domain toxin